MPNCAIRLLTTWYMPPAESGRNGALRVKKISREDILAFGFRDFKRSDFDTPGYIPDIPLGNDQKGLYVERLYYLENPPVGKLLDFFGHL